MHKQPELIGLPAVTGGSVGFGVELVFLDQVFHSAAGAVDLLVKMFGPSSQIGDDEADIAALMGPFAIFCMHSHQPVLAP